MWGDPGQRGNAQNYCGNNPINRLDPYGLDEGTMSADLKIHDEALAGGVRTLRAAAAKQKARAEDKSLSKADRAKAAEKERDLTRRAYDLTAARLELPRENFKEWVREDEVRRQANAERVRKRIDRLVERAEDESLPGEKRGSAEFVLEWLAGAWERAMETRADLDFKHFQELNEKGVEWLRANDQDEKSQIDPYWNPFRKRWRDDYWSYRRCLDTLEFDFGVIVSEEEGKEIPANPPFYDNDFEDD